MYDTIIIGAGPADDRSLYVPAATKVALIEGGLPAASMNNISTLKTIQQVMLTLVDLRKDV